MVLSQLHWWRSIPPPGEQEPLLLLYLPWNLVDHGDVSPERRMWLLEHFGSVLNVFEKSGFPVHMSYQAVDIDALEVVGEFDRKRLDSLPLISAPFGHALFGLIGESCVEHARWQVVNGLPGNVSGPEGEEAWFAPEWDIPRRPDSFFAGKRMVFPSVGRFAVAYSECTTGELPDADVMRYDAIAYGNHLVVPMKGVDAFHATWFTFQRDDSEENLAKVVASVRSLVEDSDNAGKVLTLFMDGESVLVGGARCFWREYPLKGYELWARFFVALEAAGLKRYFHGIERAYPWWNAQAKPLTDDRLIGRKYNKWGGHLQQEDTKMRYRDVLPVAGRGVSAHYLGSRFATSDVLSALRTKYEGGPAKPFVDKNNEQWLLDYDHMVPLVAFEAAETLRGKGAFLTRLRKLRSKVATLLAKDGKSFGEAEEKILRLHERLYTRYEERDMAA